MNFARLLPSLRHRTGAVHGGWTATLLFVAAAGSLASQVALAGPDEGALDRETLRAGAVPKLADAAAQVSAPPEDEPEWGPQRLTLDRAVSLALTHGFAARIARLESGRAAAVTDATRSRYLPQLLFDSQVGWSNRMDETFTDLDGKRYGLDNLGNEPWLDIYLDQVLLDMGLLRRLERDRLAQDVAAVAEEQVHEAVAYEVTRQLADLVRLESLAAALESRLEQASWLERETRHLAESGRVLAVDREEVEIQLEAAKQRREAVAAEGASARARLRELLGASGAPADWPAIDPGSLSELEGAALPSLEEIHQLLPSAPELRMLELRTRIEEASVKAAKAERLPTLQLRGGYSHYGIKRFDHFNDEAYVFVGMHLPLFDGLHASHAIRGARKARDVASLKYRLLLADKRARAESVADRVAALDGELALAERRVASSRERQRLADLALQAQRGPIEAALAARERSAQSVEASIQLRYRRLERRAALRFELGQLAGSIERGAESARWPGR